MSEGTSILKAVRVLQTLSPAQQKLRQVEHAVKSAASAHERVDAALLARIASIMGVAQPGKATDPTNGAQLNMATDPEPTPPQLA